MTKWDYIRQISINGNRYGNNGGVADLLEWCNKRNTREVTHTEAKSFFDNFVCDMKNIKKEGFSIVEKPGMKVISLIWEGDSLRD